MLSGVLGEFGLILRSSVHPSQTTRPPSTITHRHRQSDTGVPAIPPFSWVFDPNNKYLNDNKLMDRFGKLGFKCADYYRKRYMRFALFITVVAMGVTSFGCFALSCG